MLSFLLGVALYENCAAPPGSGYNFSTEPETAAATGVVSCAGNYLVNASGGYNNVPMVITETTSGEITGTMVFPGYPVFTINGTCTSTSPTGGSIMFVRTGSGSPLTWTGVYNLSPIDNITITMTGTFGTAGTLTWNATSEE